MLMHQKFWNILFQLKSKLQSFQCMKIIFFVLTGEKGVENSACFEALGVNFDSHCVTS